MGDPLPSSCKESEQVRDPHSDPLQGGGNYLKILKRYQLMGEDLEHLSINRKAISLLIKKSINSLLGNLLTNPINRKNIDTINIHSIAT